ncbi:hypothetical protein K250101E9_18660 [Enterocloster aldenensis]
MAANLPVLIPDAVLPGPVLTAAQTDAPLDRLVPWVPEDALDKWVPPDRPVPWDHKVI